MEEIDSHDEQTIGIVNEIGGDDVVRFTIENAGSTKFRGRSNVLTQDDLNRDADVVIEFSTTIPGVAVDDYDLKRWTTRKPFDRHVRIVEYHIVNSNKYHFGLYPMSHISMMYRRLDDLIPRYIRHGLANKTSGLMWKHNVTREYEWLK